MKRVIVVLLCAGIMGLVPVEAFARSNHAGWHSAAPPVKRASKTVKPKAQL